jgi:hypothetical protein
MKQTNKGRQQPIVCCVSLRALISSSSKKKKNLNFFFKVDRPCNLGMMERKPVWAPNRSFALRWLSSFETL